MSSSSSSPSDTIMVSDPIEKHHSGNGAATETANGGDNSNVPKPKRLACMICRKRKLKCDGTKPSCSTCARLGHTCAYDEVRRKSGPKRGYVKALEERLKQVEKLLKTQDLPNPSPDGAKVILSVDGSTPQNQRAAATANFAVQDPNIGIASSRDKDRWHFNPESPRQGSIDEFNFNSNIALTMGNVDSNFTWEMIGLGLEEPLPAQETIDELHQIYFEKIHPSVPMIHKFRYLAAMNLAPNQRPPVALRYAMWTLACSVTDKYADLKDLFYQRARKYVESDYVKGYGEHMISVAHAQTHILLAEYEFKMMYFPRAWMNTGAAIRLSQMMGLHRLDGAGLDVKQCLPPPRDWTEREERRRTFWMAFCEDRYASIGTGWPMTVDERDILTNLPATEDAYEMSRPEQTQSLPDSMCPSGAGKLSAFGGIVLMACLFGRNLVHLHRPDVDDRDHDLNGEFWKRHRSMDNVLLNTSLCLPSHLKLPDGLNNPNIVFTNMSIHTSTICLHQAAIFKADKNRLPASVSAESKVRCITAANEIASIMRMVSHMDLSSMNPFIAFCLYVASRVFVQYLKSRPEDSQTADALRFLLSAMNALKRRNPLTESFLVQLDVDLEALGVRIPKLKAAFPRSTDSPGPKVHVPNLGSHPRGAPCEDPSANGVMAYDNDCRYMKTSKDMDPNPVNGADIGDIDPNSGTSNTNGLSSNTSWLDAERIQLPSRERSSGPTFPIPGISVPPGHMAAFGASDGGSTNDISLSPTGQSGQPTPNSSSASEQRQNLAPGRLDSTGGSPFETSPVMSHNNNLGTPQSEVERTVNAYFNDPVNGFPMGSAGLATNQRFGMPAQTQGAPGGAADFNGNAVWAGLGGQRTGMTPVPDGVLQSIIQMGPMDTMDLGWEPGQ